MWKTVTTAEFDLWFSLLMDEEKLEIDAKVTLLKTFGPRLGRPHADTLNGSAYANMKELRASTGRSVLRLAFAFDPERNAILLIGGNKVGVNEKRFYKKLISAADCLYARHLGLMKREIIMAKSFDELADRTMTPQMRQRAKERAKELMSEMFLSELRKMTGRSQTDLARALKVKQPSIAKIEKQEDMQVSTLNRIVQALGGQLDIIAHLPQVDVRITQFDHRAKAEVVKASRAPMRRIKPLRA